MVNKIKPIETLYKGVRFRSRLEARWAMFFDELGINWEYEKEGYRLSDGKMYLPDFWLPDQKLWVEIKGEAPSKEYYDMIYRFRDESGIAIAMFCDNPMENWGKLWAWDIGDSSAGSSEWEVIPLVLQYDRFVLLSHERVNRDIYADVDFNNELSFVLMGDDNVSAGLEIARKAAEKVNNYRFYR